MVGGGESKEKGRGKDAGHRGWLLIMVVATFFFFFFFCLTGFVGVIGVGERLDWVQSRKVTKHYRRRWDIDVRIMTDYRAPIHATSEIQAPISILNRFQCDLPSFNDKTPGGATWLHFLSLPPPHLILASSRIFASTLV